MKCDPGRCEECKPGNTYIHPWGNPGAGIAIVGEQPAMDHASLSECAFAMDSEGNHGRSKLILSAVFSTLGLQFEDYYWTNAYKCASRLSFDEEWSCSDLLEEELEDFQLAIALGNEAGKVLSGTHIEHEQIWHPAFVLRDPEHFDEYVEQWRSALQREHRTLSDFE